jgi:alkylation response protein AidB-like acyl-CoA dehydrogenase
VTAPVLSAHHQQLRQTCRQFLKDSWSTQHARAIVNDDNRFDSNWWRQVAALGWTSTPSRSQVHPAGPGQRLLDLAVVAEEFGRVIAPGPLAPVNIVADTLARSDDTQHDDLLRAASTGDAILAWAVAEDEYPLDISEMKCQAEATAATTFSLRGRKSPVEYGDSADYLLVSAMTPVGPTQFLVPADAPNVAMEPMCSLDLARPYAEVRFDGVAVPESWLVGAPGAAAADIERQLQIAIVLQSAESAAITEQVFDLTLAYLGERQSFGRPLSSYQELKHRMADNAVGVHGCHAIAAAAAQATSQQNAQAVELVSAAKAWIGEVAVALIHDCVQLHGALGLTWEHDLHLYLRRATLNRATYGTPDQHRDRIALRLGVA